MNFWVWTPASGGWGWNPATIEASANAVAAVFAIVAVFVARRALNATRSEMTSPALQPCHRRSLGDLSVAPVANGDVGQRLTGSNAQHSRLRSQGIGTAR
jgi:hypothetical protein